MSCGVHVRRIGIRVLGSQVQNLRGHLVYHDLARSPAATRFRKSPCTHLDLQCLFDL